MNSSKKIIQAAAGNTASGYDYFVALLGGSGTEASAKMDLDSEDNIIVMGTTTSDGEGSSDLLVAKYDNTGVLQWSKTLGTTIAENVGDVVVDSNDNIYVSGYNIWYASYGRQGLLAKLNSDGDLQWGRRLRQSTSYDHVYTSLAVDSSDNIFIGGTGDGHSRGGFGTYLMKLNSSGTFQFDKVFGTSDFDYGGNLAIDSNDNIFMTSDTDEWTSGQSGYCLKLNTSGSKQAVKGLESIATYNENRIYSLALDSSNNVYACGYTNGAGKTQAPLVVKWNNSLTIQWKLGIYDGTGNSQAYDIAIDSSSNVIVVGFSATSSQITGTQDGFVAKFNTSGTLQWMRYLGGSSTDRLTGVRVDSNDNIIVLGETESDGAGGKDIVIAKLYSDGSGTGTYGSLTYKANSASVTTPSATWIVNEQRLNDFYEDDPSLTALSNVLVDADTTLSEEIFEVT